jgi:hypothetical protein
MKEATMKRNTWWAVAGFVAASVGALPIGAAAQTPEAAGCDRACLKGLADKLLDSMVAHDPSALPLAREYAATENSVPSALNMMAAWQTATAVTDRFYVIDPVSHQLFMVATMAEGPYATLLYGRIKAQGNRIAEVELYENRARGQGGFQYAGKALANMPGAWTAQVARDRLPTRAALLTQGRAVFDRRLKGVPAASACVLMENGKVVAEHAEVAQAVGGGAPGAGPAANADGSVPIPCGTPPVRPTDPKARVEIVDEVQGIVVAQAVVHGVAQPYLATTPTESAFVPDQILAPYAKMLEEQKRAAKNTAPAVKAMAATGAAVEIRRIYDGKLQGQHLLVNLGAPGSRSPWVAK